MKDLNALFRKHGNVKKALEEYLAPETPATPKPAAPRAPAPTGGPRIMRGAAPAAPATSEPEPE
jgi:hypothetical protein